MRVSLPGGATSAVLVVASLIAAGPSQAEIAPAEAPIDTLSEPYQDLSGLSLEELAQIDVTSVSRRAESLSEAAAAVFVITRDDIRRSGVASLPEVLRLAPNLSVQRMNAGDYAISARGFNGYETSNKLLVLIDGRSIYSTLHSGVFWDARDMLLEDIERIEVVSGPGGTLYGANAVNGVINIITRSARDTLGTAGSAGVGNEDNTVALRHGGAMGENGAWRAYMTAFTRDDSLRLTGEDATDATFGLRGGGRMDWESGVNRLRLSGDLFENQVAINEDFSGVETEVRGGNINGLWARPLWGGDFEAGAYYDRFQRDEPDGLETNDTFDVHLQHGRAFGTRHHVVWGGGYRTVRSVFETTQTSFLDPPDLTLNLANVFVQDQIALSENLTLTLGVKIEDNSFSGQEFLPNARLAWSPAGGGLLWGAVSRASRTPNRIERGLTLPGFLVPGDFQSETLTAYEVGYRARPMPNLSFSISAFYNEYEALRTATFHPVTVLPLSLTNNGEGSSYGLDAWGSYDISPRWRLSAGLSTLNKDFSAPAGSDISGLASVGDDPDYQLMLRSQLDVTDRLEFDVRLRAVDELRDTDAYVEADVRFGYRLTDQVQLSVLGQNLIEDQHVETGDATRRRAFGRSIYARLSMGF